MFWIGLIVGIIVALVLLLAITVWCCHVTKVDYHEFCDMRDAVTEAIWNRESMIEVTHNGEVLSTVTLVEK